MNRHIYCWNEFVSVQQNSRSYCSISLMPLWSGWHLTMKNQFKEICIVCVCGGGAWSLKHGHTGSRIISSHFHKLQLNRFPCIMEKNKFTFSFTEVLPSWGIFHFAVENYWNWYVMQLLNFFWHLLQTVELHSRKFIVVSDVIRWKNVQRDWNWYNEETLLEIEVHLVSVLLHVF